MTDKQYIAHVDQGNPLCPKCQAELAAMDAYGSLDVNGIGAYQEVSCSVCGYAWGDQYVLTGYVNRENEDDHEEE